MGSSPCRRRSVSACHPHEDTDGRNALGPSSRGRGLPPAARRVVPRHSRRRARGGPGRQPPAARRAELRDRDRLHPAESVDGRPPETSERASRGRARSPLRRLPELPPPRPARAAGPRDDLLPLQGQLRDRLGRGLPGRRLRQLPPPPPPPPPNPLPPPPPPRPP